MENNFANETIPEHYAQCLNRQCVRSQKCTRQLVAEQCISKNSTIRVVNPKCIPEDTNMCPFFHVVQVVRLAWGVRNLLDKVPLKEAKVLKSKMLNYFGRNIYYSIYRKERGMTPEQQRFVSQIFRNQGIAEAPAFEYYTEEYKWS